VKKVLQGGWRQAPVAVFAIALLILLAGVGVILKYNGSYAQERAEQAQGLADILAASAAAAVDFDDPVAAQDSVNAFRVNKQVRWVGVYSRDGRALAGYDRSGAPIPATTETIPGVSDLALRVSSPIEKSGQRIGTIYFEIDREAGARRLTRFMLLFGLVLVAALVVTGLGIAQSQLRAANVELGERAEALSQANELLEEQIEERANAEEQLRQSQKMQALGQLTGGIAHDFNNLLTVIQGSADMLCRPDIAEPKRIRFARAIVLAAENAASLTSQLLAFARRQPLKPEKLDVSELLRSMEDLIDRTMGERIVVTMDLNSACLVNVDRAQLQSAILNIASNASDSMPDGGGLAISTSETVHDDGRNMIVIEFRDTGSGMDSETLDRIYEPFFTTKVAGKGTGLGLSQVYGFVSQSGGEASAESGIGQGTLIRLALPCEQSDSAADVKSIDASARAGRQRAARILVVEDNEEVGQFAETLLSEVGHKVTRAMSGEEALDLCRTRKFDVVFSDVVMPGMGGLKLAETLAEEKPELPVVLATGYSQQIAEAGSGGRPVILKPYRLATLADALSSALRQKRAAPAKRRPGTARARVAPPHSK
jgi:signal transduction histidine kinase/ActR/RegA family two-component response regulator